MAWMIKRAEALSLAARELSGGAAAQSQGRGVNSSQRAFAHLADCLDALSLFLAQIDESKIDARMRPLEEELRIEEDLLQGYRGRSSLYLLMCSPKVSSEIQESCKRLKRAAQAVADGSGMDISRLEELGDGFHPSSDEEALMDSLEEGMLDTIVIDTALCRKLARQIAEGVGLEVSSDRFAGEVEKLRSERSAAEALGGKVHALYLEQFLLVLDRALRCRSDSHANDERNLREQEQAQRMKKLMASLSITGRDAPMLPLQPFICPITRDVMCDPVQIASGQTYERAAIERWFNDGNTKCPVMNEELSSKQMKSNFALKQSIAEWRERNYEARLHGATRCLLDPRGDTSVIVRAVREVRAVCEEEPLNKYKVGAIGLIGPMVRLLLDELNDVALRKETLGALVVLARDNVENQESMAKTGVIEVLVYSLTRQKDDLRDAVLLMKILSECPVTAEQISHAQGAVLFLVTLLGCDDEDVKANVKGILENVPSSDENVVIMAEANFMRPLANRLFEGSVESRIVMAKALAGMHLPDSSKTSLATEDVLATLLNMVESSRQEENEAGLGALRNLSVVPSISKMVLESQGFVLMEQKLSSVKTVEAIKVGAAAVLADLSTIAGEVWSGDDESTHNQIEVIIYKFLQLMGSLTPPGVQANVLKALLGLAKGTKAGQFTRSKLVEQRALQILLPLVRKPTTSTPSSTIASATLESVRKNAMELFCLLSKNSGGEASTAIRERPDIMIELVKTISEDPERTSILEIIATMDDDMFRSAAESPQQDSRNLLQIVTRAVVDTSQDAATVEAAVGVALKFASLEAGAREKLAAAGVIERLVQLLEPGRSMATRIRAALALAEFSSRSWSLSVSKKNRQNKAASFVYLCLPWLAPRGATRICRVHNGECTVRHSYCLIEAAAVPPLVSLLNDALKSGAADGAAAALAALATLVDSKSTEDSTEGRKVSTAGCQAIDKAKGMGAVIAAVSSGNPDAQRHALEIIACLCGDPDYCAQYGPSAQMHVIFAAQRGDSRARRIAGRILRRLELIHSQSNYLSTTR